MIWHKCVNWNVDLESIGIFKQLRNEPAVVFVIVEDRHTIVAAIEDVIEREALDRLDVAHMPPCQMALRVWFAVQLGSAAVCGGFPTSPCVMKI